MSLWQIFKELWLFWWFRETYWWPYFDF